MWVADGHWAFLPGERKAQSWHGRAQSLERPGNTQDSGFPALRVPRGERLAMAFLLRVFSAEGKCTPATRVPGSALPVPWLALLPNHVPVRECFRFQGFLTASRGSSSREIGSTGETGATAATKRWAHASVSPPGPGASLGRLHLPPALLLPQPRHRALLSNRGSLFPPWGLARVFLWLGCSGPISLLFTTKPLLRCSLLREAVRTTLLRYSPLSLPPPHSPRFITQPFSLPGLTDLHPSLSTHLLSPPMGPLESCSLLCPQ